MKNFFNGLAKFTAVLFAILFVLSFVTTLFLYSLEKNAFNAETYKEALRNESVYDRLPAVIGDQLVATMGFDICTENLIACDLENRSPALESCLENALGSEAYLTLTNNERSPAEAEKSRYIPCFEYFGYPEAKENDNAIAPLLGNLTAKDWEVLLIALIPPDNLEKMGEEIIDETFAFLNGSTTIAKVSFLDFKHRLVSEAGVDAVLALIEVQPPCTATDLLKLANLSGDNEIVLCKPPEISLPLLSPLITTQLEITASAIPDEKVFLRKTNMGDDFVDAQSTRLVMRLSPLIPIILLLLITILVVRDLLTWLRWWGIPLLTAGIISVILSLMTGPVLQMLFSRFFIGDIPMEVSGSIIQLIYNLFSTITNRLVGNIILYALIATILGLGMTISSVYVKKAEGTTEAIHG